MSDQPLTVRARWVVTSPGAVLENGEVTLLRGRILRVGRARTGSRAVDLGDVVLLPALINAHTHLELSGCEHPLGSPGMSFPAWIESVVRAQRARAVGAESDRGVSLDQQRGWLEAVAGGAAWVGDVTTEMAQQTSAQTNDANSLTFNKIATHHRRTDLDANLHEGVDTNWDGANRNGANWAAAERCELREVLGWSEQRALAAEFSLKQYVERQTDDGHIHLDPPARRSVANWGLSPHAPYSTHWRLMALSCAHAARWGRLVAVHLAESRDELEFMGEGKGAFRELLDKLGLWNAAYWQSHQPLDYLELLASAPRTLIVHGNYLSDAEGDWLAQHRQRMALVYCPRTHAFFQHPRYPLARRLQQGVRVTLGTDSRASNPDLSIWKEWQFAAQQHTEVDPWQVWAMVTTHAAAAIGRQHDLGRLAAGTRAHALIATQAGSVPRSARQLAEWLVTAALKSVLASAEYHFRRDTGVGP